jgi:hypothetical protein
MSIISTNYRLYKRNDGRIGVNPYEQEVTLLPKGDMVFARKKEFDRDGIKTHKIEMALKEPLADSIQAIEHELHGQYEQLFCEEGELVPAEYTSIKEFNQVKWFSTKVDPEKVVVFEKKGKNLVKRKYSDIPEEADIFPVLKLTSAWKLPIGLEQKFGVSFQISQLFFRESVHDTKKRKTEVAALDLKNYI